MQTYLIIASDPVARQTEIKARMKALGISPFDVVSCIGDKSAIGIGETRAFIRALSLMPEQGTYRAGVISEAELLTPQAQQSLLKTLEEPPEQAYIYVGAESTAHLLPTIVSRCLTITLSDTQTINESHIANELSRFITTLLTGSVGERTRLLSTIGKTRDDYTRWIDRAIYSLRTDVIDDYQKHVDAKLCSTQKIILLHGLLAAKQHLKNNVNPHLLLEHAVFAAGQ